MSGKMEKLYIEPTANCNLACEMCSRNHWIDETIGDMDFEVYKKVLMEAKGIDSIKTVFFGGIGEPLVHRDILDMIKLAKSCGKRAELITNGTLLCKEMINDIIDSGLDEIWISMDSVNNSTYSRIRDGADINPLIASIKDLQELRLKKRSPMKVGISFVVMKRNVKDIPKLTHIAKRLSVNDIKISNLIPNSEDMMDQVIYNRTDGMGIGNHVHELNVDIPFIDVDEHTLETLKMLLRDTVNLYTMGQKVERKTDYCRFVQEGNVFVRWDGLVSPCMALLHTSKTYMHDVQRTLKYATFGDVKKQKLQETWDSKAYSEFRQRVINFEFSPCITCGGCDDFESNETDCFGNPFPVCGACVWAQGFVQCP